jgi:hypothetical protein
MKWCAGLILVVAAMACSTPALKGKANGRECTPVGAYPNEECGGEICVDLQGGDAMANVQGKTGICAELCHEPNGCTAGGSCVAASDGVLWCRQICNADSDCLDGFVCTPPSPAPAGTARFCYATCADPTKVPPACKL